LVRWGTPAVWGREKPPAPPAARAESEAVVLLRRRAQQPPDSKEDSSAVCHGKTGQPDEVVGPVEAVKEKIAEITQEVLDKAFNTKVSFFVRGLQTKGQTGGEERDWAAFGDAGSLKPEMIACQKGEKASSNCPNQDNFSVTTFKNGYTFACVLDGHGKKGHVAATRAAQLLPFLLLEQGIGDEHVAEATIEK
ncbi:ANK1, partial [Symbiodinium sp. CCMP2456]